VFDCAEQKTLACEKAQVCENSRAGKV
jgi:hypothetical protein